MNTLNTPNKRDYIGIIVLLIGFSLGTFLLVWEEMFKFQLKLFIVAALFLFLYQLCNSITVTLQKGFILWLVTFSIGFRHIYLTPHLKIHPSELLIWFLFFSLLNAQIPKSFPFKIIVGVAIGCMGLLISLERWIPWSVALSEFKLFLVIIPVFYVTRTLVTNINQWRDVLIIISIITSSICLLGIVEYYVPYLRGILIDDYFQEQAYVMSTYRFRRATFTFWGVGPMVSIYLSMVLPLFISGAVTEKDRLYKYILLTGAILCVIGIYITGSRGSWSAAILSVAFYSLLSQKRKKLIVSVIAASYIAVTWLLPDSFFNTLNSAYDTENYYDTSALKRRSRATDAIQLIQQRPFFGYGWGGSGWVHSDILQIGANLGIPAMMLFLAWYLNCMRCLYTSTRDPTINNLKNKEYAYGLLAGLCAGLFHLFTQAMVVLAFLIIPLWFLLAAAECLPAFLNQPEQAV